MADRSQFWQNVDATKPDKLSRLSVRQLRDYQNYFLEVQGDYNPALPPHESTVASERLTLLRDEIGSRRGKRRPSASVAEQRHKQVLFWMKIGAAVAALGVFVTIITLCHPPSITLTKPMIEPSPPQVTLAPIRPSLSMTATPATASSPVMSASMTGGPSSPVTFAEIVRVESDNTLTDLQKDEFRRKHEGKMVEWTARVRSVSRLWEHKADSDLVVVFDSVGAPDTHGKTGLAAFPASYREDMVDLHSGDTIRFRGVLNFLDIGRTVSVRDCQLLERR